MTGIAAPSKSYRLRDQQFLPRCPVERAIKRLCQTIEHVVNFRWADHQRRAERDCVGERAYDQTFFLRILRASPTHTRLRIEGLFAALVGDELDRANEPKSTCLSDQRMVAERPQPRLEPRNLGSDRLDDALARINLQGLESHRGSDRVARIGEPVAERSDLAAFDQHGL